MKTQTSSSGGKLAVAVVSGIGLAAFFVGFYILPTQEPGATFWERVCRAAGVVATPRDEHKQVAASAYTSVVMPQAAQERGTPDEAGRGATLALRCTMCHGAEGMSGADAPNLAGQHPDAIYKQLLDFQRGARSDAVMGAMVVTLSNQDLLDLSHYYAALPRREDAPLSGAPALVRVGDPMRNVAPCASCHGRTDGKVGAPALEGEPQSYLDKQLSAFASGSRRNDANGAMRNEARLLSQNEITMLADHYAHASL